MFTIWNAVNIVKQKKGCLLGDMNPKLTERHISNRFSHLCPNEMNLFFFHPN
jgi:hypothetical protein